MDEKVLRHVVQRSEEWDISLPLNTQDILTNIEDSFQLPSSSQNITDRRVSL